MVGIVNFSALFAQRVFEQLPLGVGDAAYTQVLSQNQAFGDDELFFVNRHDQHVAVLVGLRTLADDLANGHVLDFDFFGVRVDFEARRDFFDARANVGFTNIAHLAMDKELFFAQLERLLVGPLSLHASPEAQPVPADGYWATSVADSATSVPFSCR